MLKKKKTNSSSRTLWKLKHFRTWSNFNLKKLKIYLLSTQVASLGFQSSLSRCGISPENWLEEVTLLENLTNIAIACD